MHANKLLILLSLASITALATLLVTAESFAGVLDSEAGGPMMRERAEREVAEHHEREARDASDHAVIERHKKQAHEARIRSAQATVDRLLRQGDPKKDAEIAAGKVLNKVLMVLATGKIGGPAGTIAGVTIASSQISQNQDMTEQLRKALDERDRLQERKPARSRSRDEPRGGIGSGEL